MNKLSINKLSLLVIIMLACMNLKAIAQKLPKIQEGSVWAPDNIKIDGKTNEWNDQFQAYNINNYIYYSISNNRDNLYLTVRMVGFSGSMKILAGGLTFTIIPATENESKISITFPALNDKQEKTNHISPTQPPQTSPYIYKKLNADPQTTKQMIDSLILVSNEQLKGFFKDIQVTGIKEIADTVISVYNPGGIRVGDSFNNQMDYIYELAIPLKYLTNSISGEKFRYNIMLNPFPTIKVPGGFDRRRMWETVLSTPGAAKITDMPSGEIYRLSTTDFSGEYTLAKKK